VSGLAASESYNQRIVRRISANGRPIDRPEVPLVDLGPSHNRVKEQILLRVAGLIDRGDFANGEAVGEFEEQFADYCRLERCVGLASGLDALRLSLLASGLEPGAGVAVPAGTFAATFEAVVQAGGVPIVVDVADTDYTIDVNRIPVDACTHLLPVHLYGQMADMRRVAQLAAAHRLEIVEDACQAHGAQRDGLRPGEESRAAAFSFYPAKNLGAMGDAGALVTGDESHAELVRALREHGETRKYYHEYVGYTARLDTIQAMVLAEKLPLLDEWNRQRRGAARFYTEALTDIDGLALPPVPEGSEPVWHLYVVRTSEPERLQAFLAERGVQTGRHYPTPPHLAPAFRDLGHAPGDFPIAEALSREALSLPIYPGITEGQLEWVCASIREYFGVEAERPAAAQRV
jgi:dTDP-4-amino-4,6-dideoxygalactose transaminase